MIGMPDIEGRIWTITNFQEEWQIKKIGEEYYHRRIGEQEWRLGKPKELEFWREP